MATASAILKRLLARRRQLGGKVTPTAEVLRGSVVLLRRPCTYKGCRKCASGQRHAATYLGYREGGKLRWLYLPKALIGQARQRVKNYRELEDRLRELSLLNVAILREEAGEISQKRLENKRTKGRLPDGGRGEGR